MTEIPALLYSLFLSYTMERIAAGGLCMKKWLLGIIAAGIVILAGVFMRAVLFDREEVKMTVVRSLFEAPKVALTFDDGPNAKYTPQLLEGLKERGIHVTFFLMGKNIGGNEELVRQMQEEGHLIGNHTYNHYKITNMDAQVTDQEISSTSSYVQMITGNRPCIMRPPTGATDDVSCANVAAVDDGYPLIMWCVDTIDWQHHDVATTCDTIRSKVKDGAIVLMHDIYGTTADAVAKAVPELVNQGFQIVNIAELAYYKGVEPKNGEIYYSFR